MVTLLSYLNIYEIVHDLYRKFLERFDPPKIFVMFSGGKDSTASLILTKKFVDDSKVIIIYNELVGNTHRLNVETVYRIVDRLYSNAEKIVVERYKTLPSIISRVIHNNRPSFIHIRARAFDTYDFWRAVDRYGLPVKIVGGNRYCYLLFKRKTWDIIPGIDGRKYVIAGIKRNDSTRRRKLLSNSDCIVNITVAKKVSEIVFSPICRFTDEEVWKIIYDSGLYDVMKPYHLCGDSLNCIYCPLRSVKKQIRIFKCLKETGNEEYIEYLKKILPDIIEKKKHYDPILAKKLDELIHIINNI